MRRVEGVKAKIDQVLELLQRERRQGHCTGTDNRVRKARPLPARLFQGRRRMIAARRSWKVSHQKHLTEPSGGRIKPARNGGRTQ